MNMIHCTASTLRAILCYINSGKTPNIAYDNDDLIQPLIDKVKSAVGDLAGSESASIMFSDDEVELRKQFSGVCKNIKGIFSGIEQYSE